MEIVAIRHGETIDNIKSIYQGQQDGQLSAKGITQTKDLRKEIENESFDIVISSDLKRARDTALLVFEGKCEIIYDKRLRERSFGSLEGCAIDNSVDFFAEIDGVEKLSSLRDRVASIVLDISEKYQGQKVAVVSHGITISMMKSICEMKELKEIGIVENCSVNIVKICQE